MEAYTPKILCVDDEESNTRFLKTLLLFWGYEVLDAKSGPEALLIVASARVDLVLLDIMMPVMSGYEVCRRIKDDEATRNIPVIMLTILNSREDRIKGIEAGADDFLIKPFDKEELFARIGMLLRMRGLNESLANAYHVATRITQYGEDLYNSFDPVKFSFVRNLDRMVDFVLGEDVASPFHPRSVIVGYIGRNRQWRWYHYVAEAPKRKLPALAELHKLLPLPAEGVASTYRFNQDRPSRELEAALAAIREGGIPVANGVACLRRELCLFSLDYVVGAMQYEESTLKQLVTIMLFLWSMSVQMLKNRAEETKYRNLTEQLPVGIYRSTYEGRILEANPAAAHIFGYGDVENFIREHSWPAAYEDATDRKRMLDESVQSPGIRQVVSRLRKSDGSFIQVRNTWHPCLDSKGNLEYVEGILEDVTEQSELDRKLRESEELFRAIFESVEEGICIVDTDETFLFANPATHRIFGVAEGELPGRSFRDFVGEEEFSILRANTQTRMDGVKSTYELSIRRPSGELRTLLISASPRRDRTGGVTSTFNVFHDITDRKSMEESMQRANQELEEKVLKRTEELSKLVEALKEEVAVRRKVEEQLIASNDKLKAMDRTKTEFLSFVAHELRTPLTSIMGFAKILHRKCNTVEPCVNATETGCNLLNIQKMKENLNIISAEGERLTSLINNVLDIARLEAGKLEWRKSTLPAFEVLTRSVETTRALVEEHGLQIAMDIQDNRMMLFAAGERLVQVMINLISNAVKFTRAGTIRCALRRIGPEAVYSVRDTGIGISENDRERVFDKFNCVGDTLPDKPAGSGLGLSICRHIVEHHGGRIWLESEEGQGSTFFFSIPLADAAVSGKNGKTGELAGPNGDPSLREPPRAEDEGSR